MNRRVQRLMDSMGAAGLDALLVGSPVEDIFKTYGANRRYLSGFTGSVGWLLVTMDAAFIAVDFRYYEQAQRQAPDFVLFKANGAIESWFAKLVEEAGLAGKRLGYEPHAMTVATWQSLQKAVQEMPAESRPHLVAAPALVEELRAIKEPEELEALERAVALADEAFLAVARRLEPGWTEAQVAWEIEKYAREHGAESLSFPTIVAAGEWAAMPHAYPRERPIREGEPIVIDMGVRVDGYCSDLTRTIVLGRPDDRLRQVFDIVLAAQLTAEELVRPGMKGEEAHMLAHNVIAEAGYGEQFGHGLGHGVGLLVHEAPRLAKRSQDELKPGMTFTIEPGIYIPGWGGVRIEDIVVLEESGARVLSRAPKVLQP
ncbi:Aminopeptidase YpdF [bacterium HR24]|nr:Aminopeptidase YpdF [bacterium HR24]